MTPFYKFKLYLMLVKHDNVKTSTTINAATIKKEYNKQQTFFTEESRIKDLHILLSSISCSYKI